MTPDVGTRLDTIITALQQVVMPALPTTEALALEQATLCISQLNLLAEQYQHLGTYEVLCLVEMASLGAGLVDCANGGPATTEAAAALRRALDENGPDTASSLHGSPLRERRRIVARAVDDLILASSNDGTEEFLTRSQRLILEHGKRQSSRDRTWFRACGMDPDGASLPPITEMIEECVQ